MTAEVNAGHRLVVKAVACENRVSWLMIYQLAKQLFGGERARKIVRAKLWLGAAWEELGKLAEPGSTVWDEAVSILFRDTPFDSQMVNDVDLLSRALYRALNKGPIQRTYNGLGSLYHKMKYPKYF